MDIEREIEERNLALMSDINMAMRNLGVNDRSKKCRVCGKKMRITMKGNLKCFSCGWER